jgi:hypothetical protein
MNRLADLLPHIANQEEQAQKYAENLAKYDECRAKASGIFQESWNEAWKETLPVLLAFAIGSRARMAVRVARDFSCPLGSARICRGVRIIDFQIGTPCRY